MRRGWGALRRRSGSGGSEPSRTGESCANMPQQGLDPPMIGYDDTPEIDSSFRMTTPPRDLIWGVVASLGILALAGAFFGFQNVHTGSLARRRRRALRGRPRPSPSPRTKSGPPSMARRSSSRRRPSRPRSPTRKWTQTTPPRPCPIPMPRAARPWTARRPQRTGRPRARTPDRDRSSRSRRL